MNRLLIIWAMAVLGWEMGLETSAHLLWTSYYGRAAPGHCKWQDGRGWGELRLPMVGDVVEEFRPGHPGIEIEGGRFVWPGVEGVVAWAGYSPYGGGNQVILAHGRGWRTSYLRLDEVYVRCGQRVSAATLLGTAERVYYTVERGLFAVNPLEYKDQSHRDEHEAEGEPVAYADRLVRRRGSNRLD